MLSPPLRLASLLLLTPALLAQEPASPISGLDPSIRDRARTVVESDREFLKEVQAASKAPAPPKQSISPGVSPPRAERPRPPAPERKAPRTASAPLNAPDVEQFVRRFVQASEGATPEGELAMYAPRVRYFDSGTISHDALEKDQRKYYQRWPHRNFTLVGEPQTIRDDGDEVTVRYRLRYELRRGDETARGQTEHIISLQNGPEGLKIASIRERKVDDER